jgi:hypothetical protein
MTISSKRHYQPPTAKFWKSEELDRIEAKMNYGQSGYGNTQPPNSSSSPVVLSPGVPHTVTTNEYWFECEVYSVADIIVNTEYNSTMSIYEKELFGNTLLGTFSGGSAYNKVLTSAKGAHTYLVRVQTTAWSGIFCQIKQHVDTTSISSSVGAQWTYQSGAYFYNALGWIYHEMVWYLPSDRVYILVDFIEDDDYLQNMDNLMNGSVAAITLAAVKFPNAVVQAAAWIISILQALATLSGIGIVNFQQDVIDSIRASGGYSHAAHSYANGVRLSTTWSTYFLVRTYGVEPWYQGPMTGPAGETGTWRSNDGW